MHLQPHIEHKQIPNAPGVAANHVGIFDEGPNAFGPEQSFTYRGSLRQTSNQVIKAGLFHPLA